MIELAYNIAGVVFIGIVVSFGISAVWLQFERSVVQHDPLPTQIERDRLAYLEWCSRVELMLSLMDIQTQAGICEHEKLQ